MPGMPGGGKMKPEGEMPELPDGEMLQPPQRLEGERPIRPEGEAPRFPGGTMGDMEVKDEFAIKEGANMFLIAK